MEDCIIATGSAVKGGYIQERHEGKAELAHRVAYAQSRGLSMAEIKGVHILHSCDNPPCRNPAHLSAGTHDDNMADMVAKGRKKQPYGGSRGRKLEDWQVRAIRSSERPYLTARSMQMSSSTARYILQGRIYKDIT